MAAGDRARIANAIKATLPAGAKAPNGGTTAPSSAARERMGLNNNRQAPAAMGLSSAHAFSNKPGSAPAPGTPPASAAMPWDAAAANDENSAQRLYEEKETGLGAGWYQTQQEFGLDPGFNDFSTNPYSKAAQLQRSYDQAKLSSVNSFAARGHLYSGALVGREEGNERNLNEGTNSLRNAYSQAQAQKVASELSAEEARNNTDNEAEWKAIQAANEAPLEAQTAPAAASSAAKGAKQTKSSKRITAAIAPARKAR